MKARRRRFGRQSADAGDHLSAGPAVHDADVAEQALELLAETSLHRIPVAQVRARHAAGDAAEQHRLQDVVAAQRLAGVVEDHEHAVRAVDADGGDQHHAAALQQELGEPAPLAASRSTSAAR